MAEEKPTSPMRAPKATSSFSSAPGQGHTLRRAVTIDESTRGRHRPRVNHVSPDASMEGAWRRTSSFSDRSLGDARESLGLQQPTTPPETSLTAPLSLAFAMLPAFAGVFFNNGSAIVTDISLLGVASVFLHASVTQPWAWYHSAQEIRAQREAIMEAMVDDDSDFESPERTSDAHLDSASEGGETDDGQQDKGEEQKTGDHKKPQMPHQVKASKGLYRYEVFALLACFAFPMLAAYLLHAIRAQLSRPSEGLVSNYNLTIFVLVSELRVLRHVSSLFQSRIDYLQREVQADAYSRPTARTKQIDDVLVRLQKLESRSAAEEALVQNNLPVDSSGKSKQEAALAKDVRNSIQPELDALNRAVRRYEKKATLLQSQTEARFIALESRLEDAIALAAAAARKSASQKSTVVWALESAVLVLLFPFKALLHLILFPLRSFLSLVKKPQKPSPKPSRPTRGGRGSLQPRYSGDRVPSRVARR